MSRHLRLAAIAAVLVVVLGGLALDRRVGRPGKPAALAAATAPLTPLAAPPTAVSSSWYCPGGTLAAGQAGDVTVLLANPTNQEVRGRLTTLSTAASEESQPVSVAPNDQLRVRLAGLLTAGVAGGAVVDLDGGGVVASQLLHTPDGDVASQCASSASDHWYTAAGSTGRDTSLLMAVLNPFSDPAIVDLSFATDQGSARPQDFQGAVVAPRSLRVFDVADAVRRREAVATTVVASKGRVVVSQVQSKGTATSALLAAPALNPNWYFTGGTKVDNVTERYSVANPNDRQADVSVELSLDQGAVEPFTLSVAPGDRADVTLSAEARVPKNVPYTVLVRTTGEQPTPIVVERVVDVASARPSQVQALGAQIGSPWMVSAGAPAKGTDTLAIQNVGTADTTVRVSTLDGRAVGIQGGAPLTLKPGARGSLRLDDKAGVPRGSAVLVQADQGLLADRSVLDPASPPGSLTPLTPLSSLS